MNTIRNLRGYVLLLSLSFLCFTTTANAQSVRGAIAGNVTDPTGAVIPGAKITAVNVETGGSLSAVSTSAGSYRFPEVPLGTYDVTVKASGFSTATFKDVLVQIQSVASLNVKLQPGATTQTVTVSANSQTVETQSSDMGGVISARQIVQLPLALGGVGALRSPEAFIFLLPGSVGPGTANNSDNGVFLDKTAGGQEYGNEVLIDGASQQRSENGSSFDEEAPSVEALQEFKITTATPPAEYGRTTGGIENFVTKSGTNHYHGTVYEIFKNDVLDANTWFNNGYLATKCTGANDTPACRATYAVPSDKKNDYGVTLGGPVRIPHIYNGTNKTFFFFSWEQFQQHIGGTVTSTVPTLAERNGDFSALLITTNPQGTNPCDGSTIYQGEIFDPSTQRTVGGVPCRTAFPNNTINTPFSTVAKNLLNYYPLPTNSNQFNNYSLNTTHPIVDTTETIRIDQNISQKSKIFASYDSRENDLTTGGFNALPNPVDPNTWIQDFTTHFGRFGWDYVLNPNLLNHLNLGTNRSNSQNYQASIFENKNWNQLVGIPNAPLSKNFPEITTGSSFPNLGQGAQNDDNVDNGLRVNEDVSWQHGRNSYKFGIDYRFQQYSPLSFPTAEVNFCTNQTAGDNVPSVESNSGNGFASELLGLTCGGNFGDGLISRLPRWTSNYYALFAEDDLKVSNNLTLNLGFRWSLDLPRHEAHDNTSNFSPTALDPEYGVPGALVFASTCHGCNTAWADTYYKDFSPRIGFDYSPPSSNGRTAIRGGGAIIYGPLQYSDFGGSMNTGYKIAPSFTSADGFSPAFDVDSGFPAYSQPPDLDPGFFNGQPVSGSYIKPEDGKPAQIYEWDMQVQQQLANDLIMTVGYIGNKAQNLRSNVQDLNNISFQDFALGDQLNQLVAGNTAGVAAPFPGFDQLWGTGAQVQRALRPFPQYDYIDTGCCLENVGMSSYEALLATLEHRFQNGLQFQVSYTWSKTITDADSLLPNNGNGVSQVQNVFNLHAEKSISTQDVPNNFVVSWLYELPFGRNKPWLNHGVGSYLLGGWQVGAVQRYLSGQPVSFGCASGIPGYENCINFSRYKGISYESPAARAGNVNPFDVPTTGADPNLNSIFNLPLDRATAINEPLNAAFIDRNLEQYRNGGPFVLGTGVPRVENEYRLNPYLHEDFSFIKNTPIRGNLVFQLKVELLNAFNRHVFNLPDLNPDDQLFGVPDGTLDAPRNLQLTGRLNF